jgi:tetratricopeptide (TPR) repeat protein
VEYGGSERFLVLSRLGAGGMGVVYRVHDRRHDQELALKTLARLEPAGLYRLKREFRSLADIVHPNLVRLHELLSEDEVVFFTMDLVNGVHFLDHLRPDGTLHDTPPSPDEDTAPWQGGQEQGPGSGPVAPPEGIDVQRIREAFRQLATGVHALHRAGKLHRDLKPSNVLVAEGSRVVILDFGLVIEAPGGEEMDFPRDAVVGTPSYMPPEHVATRLSSPAGDWYALGAMLYHALTGVPPFAGSIRKILSEKRWREPPRPPAPPGAEDLSQLCEALLRRRPDARPSAEEILRCLGEDARRRSPPAPSPASFVGRTAELRALGEALDAARGERPILLHLRGPSGIGKTTLLRRFLDGVRSHGDVATLVGRCHERESVPYKTVDSVIDDLSRYLLGLPSDEVRELLPRDVHAAALMFPVLARVEGIARAPKRSIETARPHHQRKRAFWALKELLRRIASRHSLIVCIDDFQWGDADGSSLLAELLRPPDPPPFLLVLAYRSEERESVALRTLTTQGDARPDSREIVLGSLDPDEARELARRLLAEQAGSTSAAAAVAREAEGNPFFLGELAAHLAEGGSHHVTLQELVSARLQRLTDPARELLETIAVAGRPLPEGVALESIEARAHRRAALNELRDAKLVRTTGAAADSLLEAYHDRIREHAASHMDPGRSREVHRRLASIIESAPAPDPEALATHWEAGGDLVRAARWTTEAARRAAQALALSRASELYRHAIDLHRRVEGAAPPELLEACGDAGLYAGLYELAVKCFEERLATLVDPLARASVQRKAAEAVLYQGQMTGGAVRFEEVLRTLGFPVPRTSWMVALRLVTTLARFALHACLPSLFVRRSPGPDSERLRMLAQTCSLLVDVYYWSDMRRAVLYEFAAVNAADRAGPSRDLVVVLANHDIGLSIFGLRRLGRRHSERARVIAEERGGPAERANAAHLQSYATACSGAAAEHAAGSERALKILQDDPDPYRLLYIEHSVAEAWTVQGFAEDARALLDATLPLVETLDNDRLRAWRYWTRGHAAARVGRLGEAEAFLQKALVCGRRAGDWLAAIEAGCRLAFLWALSGRTDDALRLAERSVLEYIRRQLRHITCVADGVFLAAAALHVVGGGVVSREQCRLARRVLWTRGPVSRCLRYTRPLFLAGGAAWLLARGQERRGRQRLARAVASAEVHGLNGELYDVHRLAAALSRGHADGARHAALASELQDAATARSRRALFGDETGLGGRQGR